MKKILILFSTLFYMIPLSAVFADKQLSIVAFGDSLTAGYLLAAQDAFPVQLQKALQARNHNLKIENAGVSGDTTAGGLARLDWSVPEGTDGVILELGANDALRAVPIEQTRQNLDDILQRLKSRNIPVLLAGIEAPRGLGEKYVQDFRQMYLDLSKKYDAILYPFFLEGVAMNPKLNLQDGMHPNAQGVGVVVQNILPKVEELIKRIEQGQKK